MLATTSWKVDTMRFLWSTCWLIVRVTAAIVAGEGMTADKATAPAALASTVTTTASATSAAAIVGSCSNMLNIDSGFFMLCPNIVALPSDEIEMQQEV